MDIRLEPRSAAHPKREEIERLHETMKKRELGRKRRRLWSRFGRRFQNRDNLQLSPYNITRLHCIIHTLPVECFYMQVS